MGLFLAILNVCGRGLRGLREVLTIFTGEGNCGYDSLPKESTLKIARIAKAASHKLPVLSCPVLTIMFTTTTMTIMTIMTTMAIMTTATMRQWRP